MFPRRSAASEFPNDNPELHDGLVWQSDSVTGHALPTLRLRQLTGTLPKVIGPSWEQRPKRLPPPPVPRSVEAPARATSLEVLGSEPVVVGDAREPVIEPEPIAAPESEPVIESPPEPLEAYAGASSVEPEPTLEAPMLEPAPALDAPSLDSAPAPTAFDALIAAISRVALDHGATRVAAELPALLTGARSTTGLADSPRAKSLVALGLAWRAALDGGDLAGCGDQPLDLWASELLATLLSSPGDREALRRALRRHGVAAFGMLIAA